MKIIIYQNREVYKEESKIGNDSENKVETLEFEFPEEYADFTKYIEFQIKGEKHVDLVEDNKYVITREVAKYGKIKTQLVLKKNIENDVLIFKSNVFELSVSKSINASENLVSTVGIDLIEKIVTKNSEQDYRLNTLEADNTTNKENILNLQNDNTTNKTNIKSLQDDNEVNKTDISNIKQEQTIQNTNISNLQTDNTSNKAKILDLEAKNTEQDTNIQKNTDDIAEINQKDTTQDSLIEELQTKLEEVEAENVSLKNQIPSGEATGNPIHLADSSDLECEIVPIGGVKEKLYLPEEYTQLEYIESSRTQYIDTNYKVTNNTKIYFKGFIKSAEGYAFGSGVNGQYVDIGLGTANYLYYRARIRDTSSSNKTIDTTIEIGETIREIILSQNDGFIIDGNTVGTFSEFSFKSDKNLYLFCWNDSTKANLFSNIRLQAFKIYENNILMRSFTPCYRKSDNAIGLYDTVNNVFYENLGTGNFVAGPEQIKSPDYPSEIVTVGQNGSVEISVDNGLETTDTNYQSYTKVLPIQEEMLDEDYISDKEYHNWEKIESYNGEEITTDFKSTTGELTTGATVYYKLAEPKALELTAEQSAILNSFYTYKNLTNISVDGIATLKVNYKKDQQTINKNYENRLAALEEYSTEEQVIGKWIDGKTLYKKTIIATSPTVETDGTAANAKVYISGLNAKFIGVLNAYAILDTGDIISLPYTNNSGKVFRTYVNAMSQVLFIGTNGTSFSGKTCYITLIYTKTTD